MDEKSLRLSLDEYNEKLQQINTALESSNDDTMKNDLINLRCDIQELISLTEKSLTELENKTQASSSKHAIDDEYLLFMKEMEQEGVESNVKKSLIETTKKELSDELKALEGMKCQAPHKHTWGSVVYHNALVYGAVQTEENQSFDNIYVRVMFTNPTHQEMLPCSYFLEHSNCKFSDEKCRYSHGEIVLLSSLKEYIEPDFQSMKIGSTVLAKAKDKLWYRSIISKISTENCMVRFDSSKKETSVPFRDILPLDSTGESKSDESSGSDSGSEVEDIELVVQKSLLGMQTSQALGDWEKYTKGIGSRLMQQMGYIVGTGLGKRSDGRVEPVDAVILPSGKSLDHCMQLRELAGGSEDLFSAEKRLKKEQKKQEALSRKAYEREKEKKDVFQFLNETIGSQKSSAVDGKTVREGIKQGSNRELNVASLKVQEDVRRVESDICKIKEALKRHDNQQSTVHVSLKQKLTNKQNELRSLHEYGRKLEVEQNLRKDKKKLTVF